LVSEEAMKRYMEIIKKLGGKDETWRAEELKKIIKVVPNVDSLKVIHYYCSWNN